MNIWKQDEILPKDWDMIPKNEYQYYWRLANHLCLRCGKPLPMSTNFNTYCKDCREEDQQKHGKEYEQAKRRQLAQKARIRYENKNRRKA